METYDRTAVLLRCFLTRIRILCVDGDCLSFAVNTFGLVSGTVRLYRSSSWVLLPCCDSDTFVSRNQAYAQHAIRTAEHVSPLGETNVAEPFAPQGRNTFEEYFSSPQARKKGYFAAVHSVEFDIYFY